VTQKITFEQPLNERIRTFLRIEQLVHRFNYALGGNTVWDTHYGLTTLFELSDLAARGDLKSEIMKELKRQTANLEGLRNTPGLDQSQLQSIIEGHQQLVEDLHGLSGQPGNQLKNSEFINSIKQRTAIPGGTCDFDVPAYHYWLAQPVNDRHTLLRNWIVPFEQIHRPMEIILQLIRGSAHPDRLQADKGFYQQTLELGQPFQLLRISLPNNSSYFPEISAGKHRFTVRFLTLTDFDSRALPTEEDIDFELACCAL
jgi:cell division protein ZapD